MMRIFSHKRLIRAVSVFVVLFTVFTLYCSRKVSRDAEGKTYDAVSALPYNHVGLLLGTCKTLKDHTTINPFWKYRLQAAYEIWKAGKIQKLLISGDSG